MTASLAAGHPLPANKHLRCTVPHSNCKYELFALSSIIAACLHCSTYLPCGNGQGYHHTHARIDALPFLHDSSSAIAKLVQVNLVPCVLPAARYGSSDLFTWPV